MTNCACSGCDCNYKRSLAATHDDLHEVLNLLSRDDHKAAAEAVTLIRRAIRNEIQGEDVDLTGYY